MKTRSFRDEREWLRPLPHPNHVSCPPRLPFVPPLRPNLEELCRRHHLATPMLPDLNQVVIPAYTVIRAAGSCAFKDSVIRRVVHDQVDALLGLNVLGKPGDLSNGSIYTVLRPAQLGPEENAIHF